MALNKAQNANIEDSVAKKVSDGDHGHCYLLELPGELRNEIFGLALYHPNGVAIDCMSQVLLTPHPLALSATCKQLRKECDGLLFDQNELRLEITERPAEETLPKLDAFCKYLILGAQLGSKFQGVHLVTEAYKIGRHGPTGTTMPSEVRWVFDACSESKCAGRWSLEAVDSGSVVAFSIPMQDQESAWKGVDCSLQQIENANSDHLTLFQRNLKSAVERHFRYWRAKQRVRGFVAERGL